MAAGYLMVEGFTTGSGDDVGVMVRAGQVRLLIGDDTAASLDGVEAAALAALLDRAATVAGTTDTHTVSAARPSPPLRLVE